MAGNGWSPKNNVWAKRAGPYHRFAGTALGATMWFFIMYRAKQDGPVLLGWRHPWEH